MSSPGETLRAWVGIPLEAVIGGTFWTSISEQYVEAGDKGLFSNHYLFTMMIFPISFDDIYSVFLERASLNTLRTNRCSIHVSLFNVTWFLSNFTAFNNFLCSLNYFLSSFPFLLLLLLFYFCLCFFFLNHFFQYKSRQNVIDQSSCSIASCASATRSSLLHDTTHQSMP